MPAAVSSAQISYAALRNVGWLRAGQNPATEVVDDCHTELNRLIDDCNAQRMMIPAITRNVIPLVSGQQRYALGPTSVTPSWNVTTRPSKIERAGVYEDDAQQYPVEQALQDFTVDQWALQISIKDTPGVPSCFYAENADIQLWVNFWPVPNTSNMAAVLYYWENLYEFPNTFITHSFLPGYQTFLEWNLAERIWSRYQEHNNTKVPYEVVERQATKTRAIVKGFNAPEKVLRGDPALTRNRWNRQQVGWW